MTDYAAQQEALDDINVLLDKFFAGSPFLEDEEARQRITEITLQVMMDMAEFRDSLVDDPTIIATAKETGTDKKSVLEAMVMTVVCATIAKQTYELAQARFELSQLKEE